MPLSIDTNIMFAALNNGDANHDKAFRFIETIQEREDVIISELLLLELYVLLKNPLALGHSLDSERAVQMCGQFRHNPRWQVVALPRGTIEFHDRLWSHLRGAGIARRRAFDIRTGLSLVHFGVDEFATANVRDFQDCGFKRVWNPFAE